MLSLNGKLPYVNLYKSRFVWKRSQIVCYFLQRRTHCGFHALHEGTQTLKQVLSRFSC